MRLILMKKYNNYRGLVNFRLVKAVKHISAQANGTRLYSEVRQ